MRRIYLSVILLILPLVGLAQKVSIDHVEPPFWYVGFQESVLQIMVHGPNISQTEISVKGEGVSLVTTATLDNPNYVWVDIDVSNAKPGNFEITFQKSRLNKKVVTYELRQRSKTGIRNQGFDPSDVIYLMVPDRFANGDPNNDTIEGMKEGLNRELPEGRHGGDFVGITKNLNYIKDLGMTAIWFTPVLENDMKEEYHAYHGYAATDMYKVDRRLGSNPEYLELVNTCHSMGMKVIMDMIHNHIGDQHWWMFDMPSSDWVHSYEKYGVSNFRGETQSDPYRSDYDFDKLTKAWFVSEMPDLNQKNTYLAKYLIQNTLWWIEYSGVDGIRMDTYVYPDREYMSEWATAVYKEYPQFNIVGEVWVQTAAATAFYGINSRSQELYKSTVKSVTDFPLNSAIRSALNEGTGWNTGLSKIYYVLTEDYLYSQPNWNVIFLDNHDVGRISGQYGMDKDKVKIAMGILLTMRGIPQVYYGTEILMNDWGDGNYDGRKRRDFPGGWKGDEVNKFVKEGRTDDENEVWDFVSKLSEWRKTATAVHSPNMKHFIPDNEVYVYARFDESQHVVVIINGSAEYEKEFDYSRYKEVIEGFSTGKDVLSGIEITDFTKLKLPAKSMLVLEMKK